MTDQQIYFGRGKLLLTGEYFVLDGAKALALPAKLGQQLHVEASHFEDKSLLIWNALNEKGDSWFSAHLSTNNFHVVESTDKSTAIALQTILRAASELRPFIAQDQITKVTTELDFPRAWGLGSSSTLIYTIAKWANIDPFALLKETFKGSGYDLACAGEEQAIFYQLQDKQPTWETANFNPSFKDQLYFVYLGKKQNSRSGIAHYQEVVKKPEKYISKIDTLTKNIAAANDLKTFAQLLEEHEQLISKALKLPTAKSLHFSDYWGSIKSLGAWGGDFILATSDRSKADTKTYFQAKGMEVMLSYEKLIG